MKLDFDKEKKKVGIRLKQIRKQMGFSSHETFAYKYDLNRSQYGKYETGNYNFTLETLVKILNIMDVSLSEFFNEEYDKIKIPK